VLWCVVECFATSVDTVEGVHQRQSSRERGWDHPYLQVGGRWGHEAVYRWHQGARTLLADSLLLSKSTPKLPGFERRWDAVHAKSLCRSGSPAGTSLPGNPSPSLLVPPSHFLPSRPARPRDHAFRPCQPLGPGSAGLSAACTVRPASCFALCPWAFPGLGSGLVGGGCSLGGPGLRPPTKNQPEGQLDALGATHSWLDLAGWGRVLPSWGRRSGWWAWVGLGPGAWGLGCGERRGTKATAEVPEAASC